MQVNKGITTEGREIWMVLNDDYSPVIPIYDYLRYLENKNYSPNTIKAYARNLKLYWEFLESREIDWIQITILKLSEFIHWLKTSSSKIINLSSPRMGRTEKTINHILKTVKSFYEFQTRLGVTEPINFYQAKRIDPSKMKYKSVLHHTQTGIIKTNILKLKEPRTFPGCLTKEQVRKLIDACNNIRDKFLIYLLYETGMRIGEALGLRHEDIFSKGVNEIHVTYRDDNANHARAKTGSRIIHVSKDLMRMYSNYLVNNYPEVDSDYVFVNCWKHPLGEPMTKSNVDNLFIRLATKTGIKAYPHILRHTHATELIRANWDMAYVQKRLGHSDIQTTINTYVHLTDEDLALKYQEYLENKNHD
ncbi:tyrosine-type recombinase/integrase [Nodularia sp. UHCC 0506]|uniref:tyrosine-type recombinase/integrase n=1 Tax=Nodularia sp. UHCC 0506 TaxID=3110243 RepID=UPI002B1EC6FD|nr:tyrosine-type recombinase/integrase [Nodularia sp. UHCC 0506]MEA5516959.1 tyrosine-type recombinase/integrase [Nodularia sp. UHCC 0506]